MILIRKVKTGMKADAPKIKKRYRLIFQNNSKAIGVYCIKLVINVDEAVAYQGIFEKEEVGRIGITPIFEEDCYKIGCFRVREKVRKSGIGKKLFREMIKVVDNSGFGSIVVYPNSEPYEGDSYLEPQLLYQIYMRLGFEFVDEKVELDKPNSKMILWIN